MAIQQLGPYRIGRMLGRGGMGAVYEAVEPESGTRVAVKVLSPSLSVHEDFRERFEVEIETLRKLRHPNIVRIYAFGEQQGVLFYAMELVEGRSLEELIRSGRRFHWREVTDLACRLCRALKHAHDRGVIHRDIKPANLLLTELGEIKLTDFGIAKLFGTTGLTAAGGVVGTAEYMAPEQCDGRRVTPRSDLYSLGGVLYTLLAGRPPFMAESVPQMLQLQRFADPEPLSVYAPNVPEALQQIVADLLAKDPADRVPSAMMLLKRLEAMLHGLSRLEQAAPDSEGDAEPHDRRTAQGREVFAEPPVGAPESGGSPTLAAERKDALPQHTRTDQVAPSAMEVPPEGLDLTVAGSGCAAESSAPPMAHRSATTRPPDGAELDRQPRDAIEPVTVEATRTSNAAPGHASDEPRATHAAQEAPVADLADRAADVAETAAASQVDLPPASPARRPDRVPSIRADHHDAATGVSVSESARPAQHTAGASGSISAASIADAATSASRAPDSSTDPEASPAAASPDRFTTVEDEEPERLDDPSRAWAALWSPQVWLLAASLLGVATLAWYVTRPLSPDAWYERLTQQTIDTSPESLLATAEDARQFLATFPDDPRRGEIESLLEETELIRLERRLERRAARVDKSTRSDSLSPVERAYLEAIAHARVEPELGAARLHALIDLFGPLAAESGDRHQQRCVELARRRLQRLEKRIAQQAEHERQLLVEQLARAQALASDQPERARRIWQAIVQLYSTKPWARTLVDEARAQLRRIAAPSIQPPDSAAPRSTDSAADVPKTNAPNRAQPQQPEN